MNERHRIRRVHRGDQAVLDGLTDLLLDVVEGGASVGFMLPLPRSRALAFWQGILASVEKGERILLVTEDVESGDLVGTVQVVVALPDNQPHRGDVAKMQVRRDARRAGLGAALLAAAESHAREAGKTLLVLDAVTGGDAARLYARHGWQRVGDIPDYALYPNGDLCSTTVFYRRLTPEWASPRRTGLVTS